MAEKKLSLKEVMANKSKTKTYEEAQEESNKLKKMDEVTEPKKGGRPVAGRGKVTHKIAFHIDQETKDWLESKTNTKERTPNAVVKKILMAQFDLENPEA